jgi:hypothetical protein
MSRLRKIYQEGEDKWETLYSQVEQEFLKNKLNKNNENKNADPNVQKSYFEDKRGTYMQKLNDKDNINQNQPMNSMSEGINKMNLNRNRNLVNIDNDIEETAEEFHFEEIINQPRHERNDVEMQEICEDDYANFDGFNHSEEDNKSKVSRHESLHEEYRNKNKSPTSSKKSSDIKLGKRKHNEVEIEEENYYEESGFSLDKKPKFSNTINS